jgi:hypothetical protein
MNWLQNKTQEERKAIAAKGVATRQKNIRKRKERAVAYMDARDSLKCEIKELEAKLDSMKRLELVNKTALTLTGKTLLREDEIVNAANTWKLATGVYFLIDGDKVVYVGQSVNVYARIALHHDKAFDRFAFIPCGKKVLDSLESLYIHILRPPLNADTHGRKQAPMSLDKLIGVTA